MKRRTFIVLLLLMGAGAAAVFLFGKRCGHHEVPVINVDSIFIN